MNTFTRLLILAMLATLHALPFLCAFAFGVVAGLCF